MYLAGLETSIDSDWSEEYTDTIISSIKNYTMPSREHVRRALDHEGNYPYIVNAGLLLISGLIAAASMPLLGVTLLAPQTLATLAITASFIYAFVGFMRHKGPLSTLGS